MGTPRKPVLVRRARRPATCRICHAPVAAGELVMSASAHPASWVHVSHLIHDTGVACDGPALRGEHGARCVPHGRPVYGTGRSGPGPRR